VQWEFDVDELLLVEHLRRENDAALQCVTLRHLARYESTYAAIVAIRHVG
jgi:hypothetical protein